jgi:hypothetical protein
MQYTKKCTIVKYMQVFIIYDTAYSTIAYLLVHLDTPMDHSKDKSMKIRGNGATCAAIYEPKYVETLVNSASTGTSEYYASETRYHS